MAIDPPAAGPDPAAPPVADAAPSDTAPSAAPSDDVPEWIRQTEPEESPWLYVDGTESKPAAATSASGPDLTKVTLPRFVLFFLGILLGVVALVSFALGMLAGGGGQGGSGGVATSGPTAPCVVTGRVEYTTSGGTKFPDEGAVVLLFPQEERPATEEKAPVLGLRPEDPPPSPALASIQMLKLMGAGHARTDVDGRFRLTAPRPGRYQLLVVSHHGARRAGREINRADLAAMGRYLLAPGELIGDRRYRWRAEEFQRDSELIVLLE